MRIKTVIASTGYPIDLEDIKDHIRIPIGQTNQDDYLRGLIRVAANRVEEITNRAMTRRTMKIYFDEWPYDDSMELPFPPLSTEIKPIVKYFVIDYAEKTLASTAYKTDAVSEPGRIMLNYTDYWPVELLAPLNPVSVQFMCGYSGSTDVPDGMKHAMKLIISDLYENRESMVVGQTVAKIPDAVNSLLRSFKIFSQGERHGFPWEK
jgi:uncharacterized phiE125 gp8 family phage protein